MQVSGRAVPKRYDRARPLACCVNAAGRLQASLARGRLETLREHAGRVENRENGDVVCRALVDDPDPRPNGP